MFKSLLAASILFSIALLPNLTPSAHALGCVNADVSNQVKVTGSKDDPGTQQNNVNQTIDPASCIGNANVSKSNQIYVGSEGANQVRNSNQFTGGLGDRGLIPSSVMDAGNVNVKASTNTTIYNPALDPKFLQKK